MRWGYHHLSALTESTPRLVSLEIKLPTLSASFDDFRGSVLVRNAGPGLELERARYAVGGAALLLSETGIADGPHDDTCAECIDAGALERSMVFVPGVSGRLRRRLRERGARGRPGANEMSVFLNAFASSPSFPVVETDHREAPAGGCAGDAAGAGMYGGESGAGIWTAEDITLNSIVAGEFGAEKDLLKPGCMRMTFERVFERCVSAPWTIADGLSGGGRRRDRPPSRLASDLADLRVFLVPGKDAERARVVANDSGGEGALRVGMYAGMSCSGSWKE